MKAEETRECLVNGEQVKPGTRNEEMRNGKRWKWKTTEIGNQMGDENFSFISACPFCIQQHLLERTSATRDSGEEVQTIALCISLIHKEYYVWTVQSAAVA